MPNKKTPNFLDVIDLLPGHVYWKDRNGRYLGCNKSQAQALDLNSPKDIVGKTDYDFSPKKYADKFLEIDKKVIETGKPYIAEEPCSGMNENPVFLSQKIPLKNEAGETIGLIGISFDISTIKNKEKTLEQEKQNYESTLENIISNLPGHVYWKDRSGAFLGCNQAQADSLNLTREEIIGKTAYDTLPFNEADKIFKTDLKIMESNKPCTTDEYVMLENGILGKFYSKKAPLKNSKNEVIGLLGISFDITERKALEERLEKANATKTEFIANMSHDIRTPITGMLGLIDQIKDRYRDDSDTQKDTERLDASTRSLLRLLNEIIDIVDLESGKIKETPENFSVTEIINHNVVLQRPHAEHKGITLNIKIDDNVPAALFGPRIYLDRIILNLLSNAIKFTNEGRVNLDLSLTAQPKANKNKNDHITLQCRVKDTGVGIPADQLDSIFEHFSRLTPSYQGTYEGLGLGLYTVKRYVDAMKGSIKVDSTESKGTTFTVTLPFQIGNEEKLPTKGKPATQSTTTKTPLSNNPSLLIVEDQEIAAKALKHQLNKLGCTQLQFAENGKIALELIQQHCFDLIFMDIGLPDINGIELSQRIRTLDDKQKASTPIVAVTGHAKKEIEADCNNAGIQDAYTKPLTTEELLDALKRHTQPNKSIKQKQDEKNEESEILMDQLPSIDLDDGTDKMAGDEEAAKRLINKYLVTLDETQHEFETAFKQYKQNDADPLRALLHAHIGTLGLLGLPRLHTIMKALQTAVKAKKSDQIERYFSQLLNEINYLQNNADSL